MQSLHLPPPILPQSCSANKTEIKDGEIMTASLPVTLCHAWSFQSLDNMNWGGGEEKEKATKAPSWFIAIQETRMYKMFEFFLVGLTPPLHSLACPVYPVVSLQYKLVYLLACLFSSYGAADTAYSACKIGEERPRRGDFALPTLQLRHHVWVSLGKLSTKRHRQ